MRKFLKEQSFIDRLIELVTKKQSHIVVGLDPVFESLPATIRKAANNNLRDISKAIVEFNFKLIDAVHDLVPAIKPQIAFYERYGVEGFNAFVKTINYGKKKGLIVIDDAKRNDIGSTAVAYSDGHIGRITICKQLKPIIDADAITVNPYLGTDGILPFLNDVQKYKKGIFVLVKTSNPSSIEIQDITVLHRNKKCRLYEVVANLVNLWSDKTIGKSEYSSVGAVVGATFPKEAKLLRKLMPKSYFLVPGYGAQGGKASDIVNCFNKDGYGALIAASRSINYAFRYDSRFKDSEFADAARESVIKMNEEINGELKKNKLLNW